jgi:MFS family permease
VPAIDEVEPVAATTGTLDVEGATVQAVQLRTLRLLFTTQAIGGVAVATGFSVGALLVAEQVGVAASGLAQSAAVIGSALLALPATALVQRRGRRPSLFAAYVVSAIGGLLIVLGAMTRQTFLLFGGFFLFGGGTTASLQTRYAAIDLAPRNKRGRHLSLVVWATTIGSVVGPNLAGPAGELLNPYGVPTLAAPFLISVLLLLLCAGLLLVFLRPDPIVVVRAVGAAGDAPGTVRRTTTTRFSSACF